MVSQDARLVVRTTNISQLRLRLYSILYYTWHRYAPVIDTQLLLSSPPLM